MPFPRSVLWRLMLLAVCLAVPSGQSADAVSPIAKPTGRVILSITGDIERANSAEGVELDRTMLEAIGMVELETETPFYRG